MATDVSLTTNGITFTFAAGEVDRVESTIIANTEQQELPSQGPANALLLDTNGPIKTLSISGILYETASSRTTSGTITTILSQKQWLESLINSNQSTVIFTSNYESQTVLDSTGVSPFQAGFTTTPVKVEQLKFTEEEGNPNLLRFEMTLRVGQ